MRYTEKQTEIIKQLESLVHKRFSKKNLEKKINEIFGFKNSIYIEWDCCYEDGGLPDWNAMFSTYDIKLDEEIIGDFDIYYLKTKEHNEENVEVYVTEVGYDFYWFEL